MEDHIQLTVLLAAMALSAIIGIYYVWVRKLGRPEGPPLDSAFRAKPK